MVDTLADVKPLRRVDSDSFPRHLENLLPRFVTAGLLRSDHLIKLNPQFRRTQSEQVVVNVRDYCELVSSVESVQRLDGIREGLPIGYRIR